MRNRAAVFVLLIAFAFFEFAARAADGEGRAPFKVWSEVKSPELPELHSPVATRYALDNGMIVFLLEDHELPLIDVSMRIRVRDTYEPAEQVGLGYVMATVMRSGGSEKYPGDKLDETLENMAASLSFSIDSDSGYASLSTLKPDFDKGLDILVDVMRNPAFPEKKFELCRTQLRTDIGKRNDSPNSIVSREFRKALYGPTNPYARHHEYGTISAIDREALKKFHDTYYHPNQFIMGVYGDFKSDEMLAKLKAAFGAWPAQKAEPPAVEPIPSASTAKTLYVDRAKINQTTFTMGQIVDMHRDNPDYPAIQMMNGILSGSMSARMFTEVRTKKGLAYSVWGYANIPYDRPGVFSCTALTRNEQALEAVEAVRYEVVRLIEKGVTEQELSEAREETVNSFVFNFDTPGKIIGRQLTYEYFGYPMDFAEKMLAAIKKVTVDDVNRVARKYVDPEKFVLLGVGNATDLDAAKSFLSLKSMQAVDVTIPPPPLSTDAKREAAAQELVAGALKAAGGAEAFKGISSVHEAIQFSPGGKPVNATLSARLPGLYRLDVTGPTQTTSEILAADGAWQIVDGKTAPVGAALMRKNLGPVIEADFELLRTLAAPPAGARTQLLDPEAEGDKTLEGVVFDVPGAGRTNIWFDRQTKLIAKASKFAADGIQKVSETRFSDHASFGAIKLAKSVVQKAGGAQQSFQIQSVELNPEIDAALFAKPK